MNKVSRKEFLGFLGSGVGVFLVDGLGAAEAGTPLMTLGVTADIHIRYSSAQKKWEKCLRFFDSEKVDGVMVCGDMADSGLIKELALVAASWKKVFPGNRRSDGQPVANLLHYGDHDTGGYLWKKGGLRKRKEYEKMSDSEFDKFLDEQMLYRFNHRAEAWEKCFGEKFEPIRKVNVKGYDVVLAHFDLRGPRGANNTPGLEEFLAAQKFDPKKPFFYSQHRVPKDTALTGVKGQDDGESTKILSKYPNCIAFSGHMHRSLMFEQCFWKGAFTSVQCPALQNPSISADGANVDAKKVKVDRTVMQCYVVKVFEKEVLIERRDFGSGAKLAKDWRAIV